MVHSDETPPTADDLIQSLWRLHTGMQSHVTDVRLGYDLTTNEMRAIAVLWDAGPLQMSVLADRVPLSRAATTSVVDRLEVAGFVRRATPDEDRRKTVIELTDKLDMEPTPESANFTAAAEELIDSMGDREREVVLAFLRQMRRLCDELPTSSVERRSAPARTATPSALDPFAKLDWDAVLGEGD